MIRRRLPLPRTARAKTNGRGAPGRRRRESARHAPVDPAGIGAGRDLLVAELRPYKKAFVRVLAWSVLEGAPALLSGVLVAAALDQGFLAGRTGVGMALLGVLALAMLIRVAATYAMFPHLAAVVEPLRDALVRRVVGGALDAALAGGRAGGAGQSGGGAASGGTAPGGTASGTTASGGKASGGRASVGAASGATTASGGTDSRDAADPAAAVARLTEQVESCRNLTASLLRTLRQLAVTVVAALVGLAVLAPVVLPLVLLPLIPTAWLFVRLLGPLARRRRALVLADERIAADTGRIVGGLRDVVALGAQDRVLTELGTAVDDQATAARALARASALRLLVVGVGGQLPLVLLLLAAPRLVRDGTLTSGEVAGAVLYLVKELAPALRALTATVGDWILELGVVAGRLAEAGGAPEPVADQPVGLSDRKPDVAATEVPSRAPVLATSGVTFAYGPYAAPVVRNLALTVPERGHLAIVGPSGIGKSTLAALLAGLLTPQYGTVMLRGTPLDALDEARRRREIAVVPQEAYVFAGSLRENLAYLEPGATDLELDRAVRLVGCRKLVARLGGYDAPLDNPAALSAGERQLISLARTFVSSAHLVILDEATCHLDPATESLAEAAFAARPGALIVIAHRMDSARRADQILLLDGNLPTVGTHDELLARSALYADLVGRWSAPARDRAANNTA